jgi:hypothetical protein
MRITTDSDHLRNLRRRQFRWRAAGFTTPRRPKRSTTAGKAYRKSRKEEDKFVLVTEADGTKELTFLDRLDKWSASKRQRQRQTKHNVSESDSQLIRLTTPPIISAPSIGYIDPFRNRRIEDSHPYVRQALQESNVSQATHKDKAYILIHISRDLGLAQDNPVRNISRCIPSD